MYENSKRQNIFQGHRASTEIQMKQKTTYIGRFYKRK